MTNDSLSCSKQFPHYVLWTSYFSFVLQVTTSYEMCGLPRSKWRQQWLSLQIQITIGTLHSGMWICYRKKSNPSVNNSVMSWGRLLNNCVHPLPLIHPLSVLLYLFMSFLHLHFFFIISLILNIRFRFEFVTAAFVNVGGWGGRWRRGMDGNAEI